MVLKSSEKETEKTIWELERVYEIFNQTLGYSEKAMHSINDDWHVDTDLACEIHYSKRLMKKLEIK